MKKFIKILSIIFFCLASSGIEAQTNTRIIGKLEGLKEGGVEPVVQPGDAEHEKNKTPDREN